MRSENADEEEQVDQGRCTLRHLIGGLFVTTVITVLVLVFGVFGSRNVVKTVLNWVPKNPGVETMLVLAGINYTSCVFCLAFWGLGQMVVAFVFGFYKGVAINFVTLLFASTTCFVLGRYLARDFFRRHIMHNKHGAKAAKIIEKEDIKFLILFRALPLPLFLKNYLPPVLKVSFLAFFLSVVIGGLIYCPIFAMIGAGSQSLASLYNDQPHGEHGIEHPAKGFKWDTTQLILAGVALVSMIGLSVVATLEWRKLSEEAEPLEPDGMPRAVGHSVESGGLE